LEINPQLAVAHRNWGRALQEQGILEKAVSHYRKSLQLKPNDLLALNNLAWLLATCADDRVRDGQQAVTLAERAARLTNYENPLLLDTLSATYAEVGDFAKATHWQTKAIELSPNNQKDGRRARLERYKSGRPFRELRTGIGTPGVES
jgi:Flp pilus assembly protein TadD